MDVLVVNGIGHDEWAFRIVKAAGLDGKLPLIYRGVYRGDWLRGRPGISRC